MTLPKAKPYTLDCQHVLWLSHPPAANDLLWCRQCERYEPLFMSYESGVWFSPSGEFKAERKGSIKLGTCLFKGCGFTYQSRAKNFNALEKAMHSHYMREHTKWKVNIQIADRLPPGSPPPF